jgi:hypothetical protein
LSTKNPLSASKSTASRSVSLSTSNEMVEQRRDVRRDDQLCVRERVHQNTSFLSRDDRRGKIDACITPRRTEYRATICGGIELDQFLFCFRV